MKKKLEKFEAVIDIWDFYLFYGIILFELIDLFFYKKLDVISCAICFSIIATGITISGKLPAFVIGMIEVRFGKIIDGIRKFNKWFNWVVNNFIVDSIESRGNFNIKVRSKSDQFLKLWKLFLNRGKCFCNLLVSLRS